MLKNGKLLEVKQWYSKKTQNKVWIFFQVTTTTLMFSLNISSHKKIRHLNAVQVTSCCHIAQTS